jgi:hypothetical protein
MNVDLGWDGDNYKNVGLVVFSGAPANKFTAEDELRQLLNDREYFINTRRNVISRP